MVGSFGLRKINERGKVLINFCKQHDLVVMNMWFKKSKTKLYTWMTSGHGRQYQINYILMKQCFRNSIRDAKTLSGANTDSDLNPLVAEVQTRLKSIKKKAGKRKPKWNLERIKSKENNVKEVMEQKFSQIGWNNRQREDNWGKVKETLLDILNNDIGKTEIVLRKPWITEAMVKKMEERRIAKTINIKEYRKLNNKLRRETDKAKEVPYMEEICEEIMELHKKGRYDLMYQKAQQLGGRTSKAIRTFGIEDNQGNIITDHRKALRIWEKYIQNLYDS